MNRGELSSGEIYHCFNRGVDKRVIFIKPNEYSYFIHLLYELNDCAESINTKRDYERANAPVRKRNGNSQLDSRERLVDILAFVLMPNHYHLLLKQRVDGGIAKFMQKLGTGYTMYFNEKHHRSGALFQGRYKSVHIDNDRQLLYIPHYIHLNPLSIMDRGSTSIHKDRIVTASDFLKGYRWSSYLDYIGERSFPSVTELGDLMDLFGGVAKYKKDITQFITKPNKLRASIETGLAIDADDF